MEETTGRYLCELCFDHLTSHVTDAWDGLPTAVCDDCLAPPVGHAAWEILSSCELHGGWDEAIREQAARRELAEASLRYWLAAAFPDGSVAALLRPGEIGCIPPGTVVTFDPARVPFHFEGIDREYRITPPDDWE